MKCQRCGSDRVLCGGGKSSDMNDFYVGDQAVWHDGSTRTDKKPGVACYVPYNLNIGGGDYIEIAVCLDCGQMQGTWPVPDNALLLGPKP